MASAHVERMLGEIARLSDAERSEVLNGLLEMLRGAAGSSRLTMDAVEQAVSTRERIRRRLADTGQSAGSISADLEDVREGRLTELSDDWAAQDFPQ